MATSPTTNAKAASIIWPSIDNRKPDNKGAAGGSTSGAGAQG
jgi:hypothetical protein